MKRYLIAYAIAAAVSATVAFAIQPENDPVVSQDPLTTQRSYQNTVREWSTGLGIDVASALGVSDQPTAQRIDLARTEQAVSSAQTGKPDENDDRDHNEDGDETEEDHGARENS